MPGQVGVGLAVSISSGGTVTVVSSGSLTSTALVTGGGTQKLQTPSATTTLDASGNLGLAGTLTLNNVRVLTSDAYLSIYAGNGDLTLGSTSNSNNWRIATTGHLTASTDNSFDVGAVGATRPRTLYLGTSLITPAATVSGLGSDATHTDNTVCADTVSGLLYKGSGTIGICLGTSSARFKEGIEELKEGLQSILNLAPCVYRYKPGYGDDGAKRLYGFTAEQVNEALPELVGPDMEGRPNSVDMVGIIPVLVNAIKDLAAQNELLNTRLNALLNV